MPRSAATSRWTSASARGQHEEVTHLARAEELVQRVLGDSIASLRNLHAGIDPNRVAALLAD